MNVSDCIKELVQFREQIYSSFSHRQDSLMDLLDALSGNQGSKSVVELSLNPLFRRGYSGLYKAIEVLGKKKAQRCPSNLSEDNEGKTSFPRAWSKAMGETIAMPKNRQYWLWGVDVTPVARCYAKTLKDRESVYAATAIAGQKPITLGHNYSLLGALPEAEVAGGKSWIVPMSMERVTSFESKTSVGMAQIEQLLQDESMPWHQDLNVLVADSEYSHKGFLYPFRNLANAIVVTRCRSNRVFYQLPEGSPQKRRGHPRWYGQRFDLKDEKTWHGEDQQDIFHITTNQGKKRTITLRLWQNLLMKGSKAQPMHQHPLELLQVQVTDPEGKQSFPPQWLLIFSPCRRQLSPRDAYQSYVERFRLEHGFRFTKQHLLMTQLQTPEVIQEETWVQFSCLAYGQLWVARHLAQFLPPPWQRYLPAYKQAQITPSMVQGDFQHIIQQIGTPAADVKPRGFSPGRPTGTTFKPRPRRPLVKRGRARRKKRKKAS